MLCALQAAYLVDDDYTMHFVDSATDEQLHFRSMWNPRHFDHHSH